MCCTDGGVSSPFALCRVRVRCTQCMGIGPPWVLAITRRSGGAYQHQAEDLRRFVPSHISLFLPASLKLFRSVRLFSFPCCAQPGVQHHDSNNCHISCHCGYQMDCFTANLFWFLTLWRSEAVSIWDTLVTCLWAVSSSTEMWFSFLKFLIHKTRVTIQCMLAALWGYYYAQLSAC